MNKWIAFLLAGIVLLVGADSAQAARQGKSKPSPQVIFQRHDKNGDGVLSLQEFVGKRTGKKALKAAKVFQRKDANGDGVLTFAEFMTPIAKKRPAKR